MKNLDLSVIITSFRAKPAVVKVCLDSVKKSLSGSKLKWEIIHVDNEAQEEMREYAKENYAKEISYIANDKNPGFAHLCNTGFKKANGEYILVLNDDVIVINGAIEKLLDFLKKNSQVGIVAPQLRNFNGTIQYSVWRTPTLKYLLSSRLPFMGRWHDEYALVNWDHKSIRKVGWVLGASFMVRSSDVKRIGYMDEKIFLYLEDCDLCRRFWNTGLEVIYYPLAQMYHFHVRASAQGGVLSNIFWFFNFYKRQHFKSMFYYLNKYKGQMLPEQKYNF